MPTTDEILQLVTAMRRAQKRYFATRSTAALHESKALEADVDAAIEELECRPDLFGKGAPCPACGGRGAVGPECACCHGSGNVE